MTHSAITKAKTGKTPSAYFCKHPARQFTDDEAFNMVEDFIHESRVLHLKAAKRAG
ncbi:MAG: hypothetical protein GQ571_04670 [Desulfobacterales bacterium]|nr:hypothetical protein [Desulfobacterales bacterium]